MEKPRRYNSRCEPTKTAFLVVCVLKKKARFILTGLVDDGSLDVMGNCGIFFFWDLVGHPVSFQPFRDEKNDQRDLARNAIMTTYDDNYDDIIISRLGDPSEALCTK